MDTVTGCPGISAAFRGIGRATDCACDDDGLAVWAAPGRRAPPGWKFQSKVNDRRIL